MKRNSLTKKEKLVLYGLIKYPEMSDGGLSSLLDLRLSTFSSIKRRLLKQNFFQSLIVPVLNRLGSELLAVIYTNFNPVIPLENRIKTTKKTIEVFEEIFFSIGEQDKGFSLSLSQNYTNIGKINDIRTETFGGVGLLEREYPNEVVFPFEISRIHRFFDFSRAIRRYFSLDDEDKDNPWFTDNSRVHLSKREKEVYSEIVGYPNETSRRIGDIVGISRQTVSRMKKRFFEERLIRRIVIPDLKKLGFEILAFYHIKFSPNNPPKIEDIKKLDTHSTIFLAERRFETTLISVYPSYQEYKQDKIEKIRFLKENNLIYNNPLIRKYTFGRMAIIKDFDFVPITRKTLAI